MAKAKTKAAPSSPDVPASPAPPIGMDVRRIEIALRILAGTAMRQERTLLAPDGSEPPDWPDTTIGQVIYSPVSAACRQSFNSLLAHLSNLIGAQAAINLRDRINAETREAVPLPAADPSSVVRH